jgi:hypothetical protein
MYGHTVGWLCFSGLFKRHVLPRMSDFLRLSKILRNGRSTFFVFDVGSHTLYFATMFGGSFFSLYLCFLCFQMHRPMMAWLCFSGLFKISRPCADACLSAPLQNPTMKNHVLCPRRQSQKVMERVHVLWLFLSSNTRLLYQSAQKNHSSYTMFWNSFFPQILNSCASSLKTTVATVHDLRRSLLSKYPALSSLQNKACSRKCLLALSAQNLNCTDIQLPSHLHPPASHSTRRAMVGVVRV